MSLGRYRIDPPLLLEHAGLELLVVLGYRRGNRAEVAGSLLVGLTVDARDVADVRRLLRRRALLEMPPADPSPPVVA